MYSFPCNVTLAVFTIASAASIAPTNPLVSTMPRASMGYPPVLTLSYRGAGASEVLANFAKTACLPRPASQNALSFCRLTGYARGSVTFMRNRSATVRESVLFWSGYAELFEFYKYVASACRSNGPLNPQQRHARHQQADKQHHGRGSHRHPSEKWTPICPHSSAQQILRVNHHHADPHQHYRQSQAKSHQQHQPEAGPP